MEHVVFFTDPLGAQSFRRFDARDEALRYVEHLRNDEGVEDALLYVMTEVPINFRSYYRAEVMDDAVPPARVPVDSDAMALDGARASGDVEFFTN